MKNTLLLISEAGEQARVDPASPAEIFFRSKGYLSEAELAEGEVEESEGEGGEAPKRRGGRPRKVQE